MCGEEIDSSKKNFAISCFGKGLNKFTLYVTAKESNASIAKSPEPCDLCRACVTKILREGELV